MCSKCQKYVVRIFTSNGPRVKVFQGDDTAWNNAKEFFKAQVGMVELLQVLMGPNGPYEKKLVSKGAYAGR